jgi:hypothetical protein
MSNAQISELYCGCQPAMLSLKETETVRHVNTSAGLNELGSVYSSLVLTHESQESFLSYKHVPTASPDRSGVVREVASMLLNLCYWEAGS